MFRAAMIRFSGPKTLLEHYRNELILKSFNELNLCPQLSRAIQELGFTQPSPIQAQTLPILIGEPTDFIGLAATGTGKTAAFSIPLLQQIQSDQRTVQAVVLCPTRELAKQVAEQISILGKYQGTRSLAIYGGADFGEQIRSLKKNPAVVVGTPGRIIDHLTRGTLRLDQVRTVILDEADEMISMGFQEDLEAILSHVSKEKGNIWLFSATMSGEVRKVADKYLQAPKQVQVNKTEVLPSTVKQLYYVTHESNKPEILCKLIDAAEDFYGIIFCQTKVLVDELTRYLKSRDFRTDCLHGDMDQNARERTMKSFRERTIRVLVCTDVASRGLDVKDITHVINYSIPRELDIYVHRIGRTARSGKAGFAMNLVTPSHRGLIKRIEKVTKSKMIEGKIPTRKEIGERKVSKALSDFHALSTHGRAVDLMNDSWKKILSDMSQEEIAGRFLSLMFPEIFTEQKKVHQKERVVIKQL
jgi:ATP-dependent RNA helicase DeaD